jgi:DNA-directed RNA polymerase I and III subunit RPAC1
MAAVLSKDLQWEAQGAQEGRFGDVGIRPVHEDILLMKLRPGQVGPVGMAMAAY